MCSPAGSRLVAVCPVLLPALLRQRLLPLLAIGLVAMACARPFKGNMPAPSLGMLQTADSAAVRQQLRKDIESFQNAWRQEWYESSRQRGEAFVAVEQAIRDDTTGYNNTPDVRRLRALSCHVGFLGLAFVFKDRESVFDYPEAPLPGERRSAVDRLSNRDPDSIRIGAGLEELNLRPMSRRSGKSSEASICPQWIPEEKGITPDEGERIDLALLPENRARAVAWRTQLIRALETGAARFPGDAWMQGQLVRFLVDNQEFDRAESALRFCGAEASWCNALRGLVLASAGRTVEAEAAFLASLASDKSYAGAQCADTTVRALFSEAVRMRERNRPCDEWLTLSDRTWWLADPLWSVAGNERFVEHYVRRTSLALRSTLDEDERYVWRDGASGDALKEVVLRYGWPTHTFWGGFFVDFSLRTVAADSFRRQSEEPYTVKEYAPDRVALLPPFERVLEPFEATDDDWTWQRPEDVQQDEWWPDEHMALALALGRLPEGQAVLWRRDSSLVYGVAIDDPVSGLDPEAEGPPRVALLNSRGRFDLRVVDTTLLPLGRTLRASGAMPDEPALLSLEVAPRTVREPAHRRRFAVRPPPALARMADTAVAISDPAFVLLPEFGARPPADPDTVLARLTGSTQLPRNVPLALYWESYGFPPGDTTSVEVRIVRRDGDGALRRLGAAFGLADAQRDSITIRWREPDPGRDARVLPAIRPTVGRGIGVDIRNLAPGRYGFIIEMVRSDGARARAERRVEIVP